MSFPAGDNPLYLEDGSVCYHEHCAQLLPANMMYTFCGCPVSDKPNNEKEVSCERIAGMDISTNDNDEGPEPGS